MKANMARENCGLINQGYRGVQYIGKERLGFIEDTLINEILAYSKPITSKP